MSAYFDTLNKVGKNVIRRFILALAALAATSVLLAIFAATMSLESAAYAPVSSTMVLAASLLFSLASASFITIVVLHAVQRLLAAYVAVILVERERGVEGVETAAAPAHAAAAVAAHQLARPGASPAAQAERAAKSEPKIVAVRKKCPYCNRDLPYGDVHVVCPYCGRRLK